MFADKAREYGQHEIQAWHQQLEPTTHLGDELLSTADIHELADGLHCERLQQSSDLFCYFCSQLCVSPADIAESLQREEQRLSSRFLHCCACTLSDRLQQRVFSVQLSILLLQPNT